MYKSEMDFDEGLVDTDYLRRKIEIAKRVADYRTERTKLRQELNAYKKYERSGEKPMDDPSLIAKVMQLSSDVSSETELHKNLHIRMDTVDGQLKTVKKQIQEITDLIQQYKVTAAPEMISSSGMDHLKKRKTLLEETLQTKEQKLRELETDIGRLSKESEVKNKQTAVITQITSWQQGGVAEPTDEPYLQQAYQAYKTSADSWREAKFNYDRKQIMPDFYLFSIKALFNGIDAFYFLLTQTEADITAINVQEKVDLLYKNKIVVNTTLLDSLKGFVERIQNNVEVTPEPNYHEKIFEFMQKNMNALKTV